MNGVINLLKPPGVSSNWAVVFVRKLLGVKKVGHTGTLDPGAAGVLGICVGKATKLSEYLMNGKKEYIAEIVFGKKTDTQDSYGSVLEEKEADVSKEALMAVLPRFVGNIGQITPAYSAAKQDGMTLYRLARKGVAIQEKRRQVVIDEIEYLRQTGENRFMLRVACEKGTYIRTLCQDLGEALNTTAYMSLLIRTRTSGLSIENSLTFDELESLKENGGLENVLIPLDEILREYDELTLPQDIRTWLLNGNTVSLTQDVKNGLYRVYCEGFIGTGKVENGTIKIETLLTGEQPCKSS